MEKIICFFVFICHFMYESEIVRPVCSPVDDALGYSMPEVYSTTSSAVLYRVRKAGKYFIIKVPKDGDTQSLAMLRREYDLSLGKSHPNIVNVFAFEENTVVGPGIVMEYVDGRTLSDFIDENPSIAMRERVFMQLLQAVAYIHRCGVVHNDIKPDNIMITRADNDVKLIDFGLADDDAHYFSRTPGCTPAYSSPELLAREENLDARSDIYSLGVVMRDLFGNRYSRIVSRCLCVLRDKRYANVDELSRAFCSSYRGAKPIAVVLLVSVLLLPLLYICFALVEENRTVPESNTVVLPEKEVEVPASDAVLEKETVAVQCDTENPVTMDIPRVDKEAMIAQVENDVAAIYGAVAVSIENVPYYEFAAIHILSFCEVMAEYQTEQLASVPDADSKQIIGSAYIKQYEASLEKLWKKAGELPMFSKASLPLEEVLYYDSLVTRRLPFAPYKQGENSESDDSVHFSK